MKTKTDLAWEELCNADSRPAAPALAPTPRAHPFAQLGPKPYAYGGSKHGEKGTCALCGKRISNLYFVTSGDGKNHALGSECVLSLHGNGFEAHVIVGAVKTAKKRYEKAQRATRAAKANAAAFAESVKLFPAECQFLANYTGNFDFYLSLKNQLNANGGLSDKQWECVSRAVTKNEEFEAKKALPKSFSLAAGTILVVSKFLAHRLEEELRLNRPHFALEVTEVQAETEKAYKVRAKLTAHRTNHCCVCGLKLTNSVSVLAGIGPICADRWEVSTTEELQAKLATEYKTEVNLWVPKSQIKERKANV